MPPGQRSPCRPEPDPIFPRDPSRIGPQPGGLLVAAGRRIETIVRILAGRGQSGIVLTPHVGWRADGAFKELTRQMIACLTAYFAGEDYNVVVSER